MNVATLQQFLRSLLAPLQTADAGPRLGQELERACRALEPFRSLDLDTFAGFLGRCDEYQRTGAVPPPAGFDLGPTQQALRTLDTARQRLESASQGNEAASALAQGQRELAGTLTQLARSAGLSAGVKVDPKWADRQVVQARLRGHARVIRALAAHIADPASFERDDVQAERRRLEELVPTADWKALAAEFGVPGGKGPKVLEEILAKLTGHRPAKAKPTRKAPAAADRAHIAELATELQALLERSKDPKQVAEGEIDAELSKLEALKANELAAVARQAGIENPGKAKGAVLNKIRDRLTAARRVLDEIQV